MRERLIDCCADFRLLRLQRDRRRYDFHGFRNSPRIEGCVNRGRCTANNSHVPANEGLESGFLDLNGIRARDEVNDEVSARRCSSGRLGHVRVDVGLCDLRIGNYRASLVSHFAVNTADRLRVRIDRQGQRQAEQHDAC